MIKGKRWGFAGDISTGGFSKEAKYEAERSNEQLTLIDAGRLVQLIVQNYDNFDVETRLLIPFIKDLLAYLNWDLRWSYAFHSYWFESIDKRPQEYVLEEVYAG